MIWYAEPTVPKAGAADPDLPETPVSIARTFADDHADITAHQNRPETLTVSEQFQLIAAQALLELCNA